MARAPPPSSSGGGGACSSSHASSNPGFPLGEDVKDALQEVTVQRLRALKLTLSGKRPRLTLQDTFASTANLAKDFDNLDWSRLVEDATPCIILLRLADNAGTIPGAKIGDFLHMLWIPVGVSVRGKMPFVSALETLRGQFEDLNFLEVSVSERSEITLDEVKKRAGAPKPADRRAMMSVRELANVQEEEERARQLQEVSQRRSQQQSRGRGGGPAGWSGGAAGGGTRALAELLNPGATEISSQFTTGSGNSARNARKQNGDWVCTGTDPCRDAGTNSVGQAQTQGVQQSSMKVNMGRLVPIGNEVTRSRSEGATLEAARVIAAMNLSPRVPARDRSGLGGGQQEAVELGGTIGRITSTSSRGGSGAGGVKVQSVALGGPGGPKVKMMPSIAGGGGAAGVGVPQQQARKPSANYTVSRTLTAASEEEEPPIVTSLSLGPAPPTRGGRSSGRAFSSSPRPQDARARALGGGGLYHKEVVMQSRRY